MNIFLVDYENVSMSGLDGTKLLKKKDKIYIFYSIKTKDISMDIIHNLVKSKADFKLFKLTKTAKNALDFQLVLFLGTRIKKYGKKAKYYIISADNGYQSSIDFAKEYFRIEIKKAESLKEAIQGVPPKLLLESNPKVGAQTSKTIPDDSQLKTTESIRSDIEKCLESNAVVAKYLNVTQIKQISALLVDSSKNTREIAIKNIKHYIGAKRESILPNILECCKDYIRD